MHECGQLKERCLLLQLILINLMVGGKVLHENEHGLCDLSVFFMPPIYKDIRWCKDPRAQGEGSPN